MSGKKIKLCACGSIKRLCQLHSPQNFCNCKKLIKNCSKCKPFIGRCCSKSRSMCRVHGGWSLCKCGSSQHHSRCSSCGSGAKLCSHGKRVNNCGECLRTAKENGVQTPYLTNTGEICVCGKARKHCALHGGLIPTL
jgi:hypothetical protein